ncbi:aspartic peptidase domain-containing protein, partial [Collybia nuda]
SSCSTCSRNTPVFDGSKSTSLQLLSSGTNIRYGSGEVAGQLAQDVVTMGPFTLPQQTFLSVEQTSQGFLDGSMSGILGLAFQGIAATKSTPFWQTLADNGTLTTPDMSFWLTRFRGDPQAPEEGPGGTFTLGGTNSTLFSGEIEFLDMPAGPPSFWLLNMKSVTVQGKNVPISTGASALSAIDTGTTLIGGPTEDVKAIWDAVPGSLADPNDTGFFSFPCSTDVEITMSFGGKSWPISTKDMNLGQVSRGSTQCLGGIFDLTQGSSIVAGGGNPNWVVGATFLKNVYSVFRSNPPSVGFAELSVAAGGSGTGTSSSAGSGASLLTPSTGSSVSPPPSPSASASTSPPNSPPNSGGGVPSNTASALTFAPVMGSGTTPGAGPTTTTTKNSSGNGALGVCACPFC